MRNNPYNQQSYYKEEHSTAHKLPFDLQQSQRQYNILLKENQFLKQKLKNKQHVSFNNKYQKIYTPQQIQARLYNEYNEQNGQNQNTYEQKYCGHELYCPFKMNKSTISKKYNVNDTLRQKNRFLQRKVQLLRYEYEKQSQKLESLYEKAKLHSGCQKQCYEQKYYNLLKLTSPY